MNVKCKKFLCFVMSVILLTLCITPSFAAKGKCLCEDSPILIITGFSEYDLINYDTNEKAWVPSTDSIMKAVESVLPALTKYLASPQGNSDADAFCDSLIPAVNTLFDPVACNPDGEVKHANVGVQVQYTESVEASGIENVMATEAANLDIVKSACNAVGADHVWVYGLDWRVDPMVIADDIKVYVDNIKATTGHDKVSISGISMGGAVMAAYLEKYGTDDISNVTMISSAFTGLEMVGQLFTGNIKIDEQGLYKIITESIGDATLSNVIESTEILKKLIPVIDDIIAKEKDRIFSECLIPCFGYNTGIWSFVPDAYYEQAKVFMNARMNQGTSEQAQTFWARVDDYHYNVQGKIGEILNTAKNDGVFVGVVSNYNMQMPPVTGAFDYTGDQVIETMHSSGFATVAKQGTTLGENYKRNPYLSQDKMIDASTCYLPQNTWFIKNEQHVGFSEQGASDNGAFYGWLLSAHSQYDIHTSDKYPQYMVYDKNTYTLSRLSPIEGDANCDGVLNISDARAILKYIVQTDTFNENQLWAADKNCNGSINIVDARLVLAQVVS